NKLNALTTLTLTLILPALPGVAPLIQITGEVGGRVTFFCPSHKDKMLTLFYLQKGTTFVNGYHNVRDAELYRAIPHSHVNHTERTVDMWALKVSDSGEYSCHVQYSDSMKLDETRIHLTNYSTPTLSVLCDSDSSSCQVTCASYGGYPSSEVMWNSSTNANSQWWTPGNSSEEADPDSMLINSSSTVIVNCSGPLQTLNCSVGGFTSDNLTVCKHFDGQTKTHIYDTNILSIYFAVLWISVFQMCHEKG
uniref:Ig-like domain-containing protein n=1 Tax=Myripristis murdjan TaxID=586833 RepID=A0A668A585_9TELE